MRKVCVAGVGMTKFGRSQKSSIEMFAEAAMEAIVGSSIKPADIQCLYFGNVYGDLEEGQTVMAPYAAREIGLSARTPSLRFEGACASASVAIRDAFIAVAGGFYDLVLAGGTERELAMGTPLATRAFEMASEAYYEGYAGITFPGVFAMLARLYSKKYGVPLPKLKERMAMVAVKNHKNGAKNPLAQFRNEITVEEVLDGPMIAEPLQLLDCCPFTDGAAAIVITTEEKAKKMVKKPVYIRGVGQGSGAPLYRQKDFTLIESRVAAAKTAYAMAGIEPKDVDVVEIHDCFTIAEIVASECLGLFDFGTASEAVEKGETRIGGRIPINPSGGLKSKGHPIGATGAAQSYEIVKQLRGEFVERGTQVEGAKIGLTDTLGGDSATLVNIIYGIKG